MVLDEVTRDLIDKSVLCWLATVSEAGEPSVSPKELWGIAGEDSLVIAEIAFANGVTNIRNRSRACVSFVEIFRQKGMKIYVEAEIIPSSTESFQDLGVELLAIAGDRFVVRNLIHVHVDRASKIIAPGYMFFPDKDEEKVIQEFFRTYGVHPRS